MSDADFLVAVHANNPGSKTLTDEMLLKFVKTVCTKLDSGVAGSYIVEGFRGSSQDTRSVDAVVQIVKARVHNYCPKHDHEF